MKTFDQLVRAIVEGQVNSFLNDHPEVLDTGTTTWKTPRYKTRRMQLKDSIAKRIVLDLTCPLTKAKLIQALTVNEGDPDVRGTVQPGGDDLAISLDVAVEAA